MRTRFGPAFVITAIGALLLSVDLRSQEGVNSAAAEDSRASYHKGMALMGKLDEYVENPQAFQKKYQQNPGNLTRLMTGVLKAMYGKGGLVEGMNGADHMQVVGRMLEAIEGKESELDIERPGFSYGVKDALKGIKADIDTAAGETGSLMELHNTVLASYSPGSSQSEMSHAQVLFSFVSEDHQRLGERLYLLQQTSEHFKNTRKAIIAARENNSEGGGKISAYSRVISR
ncbi:MAG: hypothetical protein AAF585_11095, partial [Verrucomicrobiota bacterium]